VRPRLGRGIKTLMENNVGKTEAQINRHSRWIYLRAKD
jgi:hypothetical protein